MKVRLLLGLGLSGVLSTSASAQDAPVAPIGAWLPSPPQHGAKRTFEFRLKHVTPSLMAFWLDPKNNDAPSLAGEFSSPLAPDFKMPEGVNRIVAIDPQNALLVFGTPECAEALREIIARLDGPQQAACVELKVALYWLDSRAPGATKWLDLKKFHLVGDKAELDVLVKASRARRVEQAPALFFVGEPGRLLVTPVFAPKADAKTQVPKIVGQEHPKAGLEEAPTQGYPLFFVRNEDGTISLDSLPVSTPINLSHTNLSTHFPQSQAQFFLDTEPLLVREGEPFFLRGRVAAPDLKTPDPRFDTLVVELTPHFGTKERAPMDVPSLPWFLEQRNTRPRNGFIGLIPLP